MKARFILGMPALSGKSGELTFCINRHSGVVYVRRYKKPRLSENHHKFGAVTKQLLGIKPSDSFRQNLQSYVLAHRNSKNKKHRSVHSWVNLYLRMMHELVRLYPWIDLHNLTKADIYTNDLPCKSVKEAVEAKLLPKLPGWELLDSKI